MEKKISVLNALKVIITAFVMSICFTAYCSNHIAVPQGLFPIVYQIGENEYEILPVFIPERAGQIWGYEFAPGMILAKKRGAVNGLQTIHWTTAKRFAESATINGKKGRVPSIREVQGLWSETTGERIDRMDKFLVSHGVNAEKVPYRIFWLSRTVDGKILSPAKFAKNGSAAAWNYRVSISKARIVLAF